EAPETGETAEGAEAPPRAAAPATIDDFVAGWATLDAELQASGGRGLAVLSPSFSSPTLARLAGQLRQRFPQASWTVHDAVSAENELDGIQAATGGSWLPVRDFSKADVVLALDCDFLLTDGDVVANARGFAERRRVTSPSDPMNRLYAVEGTHSLTGANADHRLRLASGRVAAFVASLTSALAARGLDVPAVRGASAADIDEAFVGAVAADLLAKRGSGLIVAGRRQPAAVHAAVYALNAALGNVGTTVRYRTMTDAGRPSRRGIAELTRAMASGQVTTLVVLGSNPAYDATADLGFTEALGSVSHFIHLGSHVDETAAHANWHVPQAHFLEAWGDVRAVDGTASVIQP
ncbi:MAG: hypothetical protein GWO04_04010, partial [Actinobacteria bacterium]|nr:hypothetical protein [Actinomycetota bacterium]NIW26352.1 hypothetical protein [Actinomycetota bacterium]